MRQFFYPSMAGRLSRLFGDEFECFWQFRASSLSAHADHCLVHDNPSFFLAIPDLQKPISGNSRFVFSVAHAGSLKILSFPFPRYVLVVLAVFDPYFSPNLSC